MARRTEQSGVATARARLSRERGGVRKDWGGRLPFALVYPNSYRIGMSNLGLQVIYRLLNAKPDVVCERAFYDPPPSGERTGGSICSRTGDPCTESVTLGAATSRRAAVLCETATAGIFTSRQTAGLRMISATGMQGTSRTAAPSCRGATADTPT